MGADDDLFDWEHGFSAGHRAFVAHDSYPSPVGHSVRWRMGADDGWVHAAYHAKARNERALIAEDHRAHYGDLRYEPVSRAARALALDVAESGR